MKFYHIILFLLLIQITQAQVVNVEKKRKEKKEGLQGKIGLSLNITKNTKRIIEGNNTINLQYSKKAHTLLLLNDYSLMSVQNDVTKEDLINKNFQHLRYNYTFKDSSFLTFETFFQRQQNKVKYLDFRALVGTGFRISLINNDILGLHVAPLLMYEKEILSDSLKTLTNYLRGNFYASFYFKLTKDTYISHVTYFQPALYDFNNTSNFYRFVDYRISSETTLTLSIIKNRLEYNMIYQLSYDAKPPIELKENPLFYTLKNKLTFKF